MKRQAKADLNQDALAYEQGRQGMELVCRVKDEKRGDDEVLG